MLGIYGEDGLYCCAQLDKIPGVREGGSNFWNGAVFYLLGDWRVLGLGRRGLGQDQDPALGSGPHGIVVSIPPRGVIQGVILGDTRSLDYGSCAAIVRI